MRAIVYSNYGSPDSLRCEEVEKPGPGNSEVLIKVHAASLNPLDWHFMRGTPYPMRIATGLGKPKIERLGVDVAGRVEAAGSNVTRFKPGDDVFGGCRGAFAEYVCAAESAVVLKGGDVTFEQAASVPVAGTTALQALRNYGRIQPGQKVLINGAAGGVGTFAVQIARSFGADVTGVCSTRNVDMVRSIGADRVIDYIHEDFTQSEQRYDVMLDSIGNRSLSACRRVMTSKGIYVAIGGPDGRWVGPLGHLIKTQASSPFVSQKMVLCMTKRSQEDLITLRELIESGKVTPVIDRRYKLGEVPEAMRYLEEGHARGKVIIEMESHD